MARPFVIERFSFTKGHKLFNPNEDPNEMSGRGFSNEKESYDSPEPATASTAEQNSRSDEGSDISPFTGLSSPFSSPRSPFCSRS